MAKYECFICNSCIIGTMFKAYDKHLCTSYCRELLINNYRLNSIFQLEKIQNTHLNEFDFSKIYESPDETLIESLIENKNNRICCININNRSCIYMYNTNYSESILRNIMDIVIKITKSILI